MATRKTYINSDEELVIKGALTIEGNVTQVETTQTINRLETDQFIINSDGDAVTAKLSLTGTGTDVADISYNTSSNVVTFNKDISATNFQGDLVGSSSNTTQFTSAVTVALSGDVVGSATFIGAGNTATISTAIQPNSVALGTDTTGSYLATLTGGTGLTVTGSGSEGATPTVNMDTTGVTAASYGSASGVATFTVNGLGQLTTAATTPIQIATSQITNLQTDVEAYFSVTDTGGDGSLAYNNTTGVFTYTGPSASEVRAHLSAGTGINYSGGAISTNDSAIVHDNLSGFVANEHVDHSSVVLSGGDGITNTIGDISSSRSISVDNTVVRTTGSQTISGAKTFSGNQTFTGDVDFSGAGDVAGFTVDGDLVVTGDITVTTLNATTETNSVITTASLTLRDGASSNADAQIFVEGNYGGNYPNLKWNSSGNRWQFSNNGTAYNDMLLLSDITGGAGLTFSTGDIAVGAGYGITVNANNIELTNASVRALFSVSDAGGDGSLSYNNGTGVITYTGPSATEVRAHLSVGTNTGDGDFTYNDSTGQMHYVGPTSTVYRSAMQGQDGIDYNTTSGNIAVDSTVIRTTGNQSLAGDKTFTGKLIVPTAATTTANAIYSTGNEAYIYINGVQKQITPTASVGSVEDVGSAGLNMYAGSRVASNVTYHGVKSIDGGAYTNVSESGNVVTVEGDISAIRGAFSASGSINYDSNTGAFSFTDADRSDATIRGLFSAGGSLAYDNSTGAFSFTERSDAGVRSLLSGTGLISYNSGTGVISTTANNYALNLNTDTNSSVGVPSGNIVTIAGGTGITTSHSGTTVTIAADNVGDMTSVSAGAGLTGGGSSGDVTLAVGAGTGITVNTNDIAVNMGAFDTDSLSEGSNNLYYTNARADARVDAGFTAKSTSDLSEGTNLYHTTARARAAISATGPLSYNSSTGVLSLTEVGDISQVNITAGVGLSGSVNTTTGAHTQTIDLVEASSSAYGGIKVGYTENSKNYPVELDSGKAFVNVPWVDTNTNTTYTAGTGLSLSGTTFSASGLTISHFNPGSIQLSSESFSNDDTSLMTSAAIEDKITSYGYSTENTRDIQIQTGPSSYHQMSESTVLKFQNSDDVSYTIDTPNTGDLKIILNTATANTANTIVKRDGSGNFAAGTITATATNAQYADLAENYVADADYEPGTVLIIGGEHEVTESNEAGSFKIIGVVSTDPAHLMNSNCEGEHIVAVALRGRVPCKVTGNVNKGDIIVSGPMNGHGMVAPEINNVNGLQIIGRALESKLDAGTGIVEIIV